MCGITGGVWTDPRLAIQRPTLERMTDVLRHRGPDDQGVYPDALRTSPAAGVAPGVAFGHRRLAVIDVAGGRQPIGNEDGTVWVMLNGEIYNYRALRQRLEGAGHTFRTASDTETLVHLYEDEGLDFLGHLEGMFALALWDETRRRLILARDRLGQKPLVYHRQTGRLTFASQLKSLLQLPDLQRAIDPAALDEYLTYQYVPHPNTIFQDIRKLPPAHYAVYEQDTLTVARYWQPGFQQEVARDLADDRHQVAQQLEAAVAKRLESEVPLGAFLSGGVDSSIVVALMQRLGGEQVKTFSIGFPQPEYDETRYARLVARHLQTDHHEFQVAPNAAEMLPELVWHFDEPMADSSALPTYYLARAARQHLTVALTGDGGDELFGGYPRYRAVRLAEQLPASVRRLAASSVWQQLPGGQRPRGWRRRLKRFAGALALPAPRRYAEWIAIFNETWRAGLYADDWLAALPDSDPLDFLNQAYAHSAGRDFVSATMAADLVTYLPCDLMTKVDVASMACGLECRQPFLDHRLVETAISMPVDRKLRGRRSKWILQQAFADLLPEEIFRRPKMGFGVPLDRWFRHELRGLVYEVLLDPSTIRRGYFRPETIRQLLDQHCQRRCDHAYRIWALLVLELWMRQWVD